MSSTNSALNFQFTEQDHKKFDAALDFLYTRGYEQEVKFQPPKMIGDLLIQYSIMRIDPNIPNFTWGDILVRLETKGAGAKVSFWVTIDGKLEEINFKQIQLLEIHNSL